MRSWFRKKVSVLCGASLVIVLGVSNNSPNPVCLTWIKLSNYVMLSNRKHVSTLSSYVAIINGIFPNPLKKKKQQTQTRWKLKMSLSCTAWLGQKQMILNKIPLVHFKLETLTRLDIILFNGQVMYILYRKIYMSCIN